MIARPSSDRTASPRYVLSIDTALGATSACLLDVASGEALAAESLPMERGHAEALLPLLDRLVGRIENGFAAIERVAVTVGPGSFTGIRVGVSAARAIGLACKIPVVGVSTLSALAAPSIAAGSDKPITAAIDAKHGAVYAQTFSPAGAVLVEARHASISDVVAEWGPGPRRLVGSGAPMVAIEAWSRGLSADLDDKNALPDILFVARLGSLADPDQAAPRPLYLKPPDARPIVLPPAASTLSPIS